MEEDAELDYYPQNVDRFAFVWKPDKETYPVKFVYVGNEESMETVHECIEIEDEESIKSANGIDIEHDIENL